MAENALMPTGSTTSKASVGAHDRARKYRRKRQLKARNSRSRQTGQPAKAKTARRKLKNTVKRQPGRRR